MLQECELVKLTELVPMEMGFPIWRMQGLEEGYEGHFYHKEYVLVQF